MRQQVIWNIGVDQIYGTLDSAHESSLNKAVLIVSGGNEIRSGSHGGQSQIAQFLTNLGYHVLRYDRRGVGDSSGINHGFDKSHEDILAAVNFLRAQFGHDISIAAFGNCDAASALLLNHDALGLSQLILANPWTIDTPSKEVEIKTDDEEPQSASAPSAAAIRARYWARIKNPQSIIDLLTGKINLRKLIGGLLRASKQEGVSDLALKMANQLSSLKIPTDILIADKDTTAIAFMAAYKSKPYENIRNNDNIGVSIINSASHSFADETARSWLYAHVKKII